MRDMTATKWPHCNIIPCFIASENAVYDSYTAMFVEKPIFNFLDICQGKSRLNKRKANQDLTNVTHKLSLQAACA